MCVFKYLIKCQSFNLAPINYVAIYIMNSIIMYTHVYNFMAVYVRVWGTLFHGKQVYLSKRNVWKMKVLGWNYINKTKESYVST